MLSLFQKHHSTSKEHKRTINQMNSEEHKNSDSDNAFSIVNEKHLMMSVNIGYLLPEGIASNLFI